MALDDGEALIRLRNVTLCGPTERAASGPVLEGPVDRPVLTYRSQLVMFRSRPHVAAPQAKYRLHDTRIGASVVEMCLHCIKFSS